MRRVMDSIRHFADSNASIVLSGESGTGKELAARTIHELSPRREGPYIGINCAAIPENLLESELFGHERGAFTGAERRHEGCFEQANGGTLLLDEITETKPEIQAKLLGSWRNASSAGRGKRRNPAGCAHHRGLQPRPESGGPRWPLPRGPLLPPQCVVDHDAAACASGPRTFRCWSIRSSNTSPRAAKDASLASMKPAWPR